MFDYNRVAATEVMGLKIKTEKVNGAIVATTNVSTPVSPARARASFGRSQPFFIGVAGMHRLQCGATCRLGHTQMSFVQVALLLARRQSVTSLCRDCMTSVWLCCHKTPFTGV